jgi:hypothetical protein
LETRKKTSSLGEWLRYPAFAYAATLILHFASGIAWGLSAFAILVGWPALGTLVTADDDLPGSWSNPEGTIPPPWRTALFWGQLSMGAAISASVTALETGVLTRYEIEFALAAIAAGVIAFVLLRRNYPWDIAPGA